MLREVLEPGKMASVGSVGNRFSTGTLGCCPCSLLLEDKQLNLSMYDSRSAVHLPVHSLSVYKGVLCVGPLSRFLGL